MSARTSRRAIWPFLVSCGLSVPVFGQREPARHALLIGIDEYASPTLIDLRGAVNDVRLIQRILTTRFGFAEKEITVLTNGDATRAAILDAFEALTKRAHEDDLVYIHYSGHGSQVEDFNGDEDDQLDETILPHDAREDGVPDIVDDEFEALFAKLAARNAFIVFDSCHSGTVTRSASLVRPRFAPRDERVDLYQRFATTTRDVVVVEALPHVLMTGAPSGEEALDGPVDGGWYGLFSYALARGMDALGPDATPVELHAAAKRELKRIQEQLFTAPPEPQLEAPQARLLLPALPARGSSGATPGAAPEQPRPDAARRSWLSYEVRGNRVRLIDGASLNAQPGSQWGIYGRDEREFRYGNALALGIVDQVDSESAWLAVQFQSGALPRDGRATLIAPPDVSSDIPLRIDAPETRRSRLERALVARVPSVRIVDERQFSRFILTLSEGAWRVSDAGGLRTALSFPDAEDSVLAEGIGRLLTSSATATALLGLDNPASSIGLWVSVARGQAPPMAPSLNSQDFDASYRIRGAQDARTSENSLMLDVRADRDVYLTIVDVDTEGGVNLLFPNDYQREAFLPGGFVRANAAVRIPDSLDVGNRAGFHWDYAPPAGKDTVRVFATTSAATAENIRRMIADHRGGTARSALSEMRSGLTESAVRGVRVVAADSAMTAPQTSSAVAPGESDWAAASIVIDVRE